MVAHDINEQLFNDKQFYFDDVVGEDGDVSQEGCSGNARFDIQQKHLRGKVPKDPPEVLAKLQLRDRQKKKACQATPKGGQIVFCLETKYDVLSEVCASFENWRPGLSAGCDFDLLWCDGAISADRFMKLKPYQKMNHFVGMSSITRKNSLGRNLLRMRKQYPKEFRFFPDTWILPTDLSDFKQQFGGTKKPTFIIKPDNGCQGKGIFLVRDVDKVPMDFVTAYVAQRYIHRPLLLDGFKFDLRLYVLVVGCDPLRIFLHRCGLVRLASEPYVEPSGKNLAQSMVHLTNYAINKMNPNFEENTNPDDAQDGHKRSWEAVQAHLEKLGHDIATLNLEIEDLIIKTLLSVQPSLAHFYHSCQPEDLGNAMCFEVLGFDVILDTKLQPWLLEVNHAPSFGTDSELDRLVKSEVLRDTFELVNMSADLRKQKKREARWKMEQWASGALRRRQSMDERMCQEKQIALDRTVWEDAHLNGFKRLYPTDEREREYMQLHEAAVQIWEMIMGGNSRKSVRLAQPSPDEEEKKPNDTLELHGDNKRTTEDMKRAMDRLVAGYSAQPRPSEVARARHKQHQDSATSSESGPCCSGEEPEAEPGHHPKPWQSSQRQEVQVGDVIRVQTNRGWEMVTVKAKRGNGKIDIEFEDGECMDSVLPRILRDSPVNRSSAEENFLAKPPSRQGHNKHKFTGARGFGKPMSRGGIALPPALPPPVLDNPAELSSHACPPKSPNIDEGQPAAGPARPQSSAEDTMKSLDKSLSAQIRNRRSRMVTAGYGFNARWKQAQSFGFPEATPWQSVNKAGVPKDPANRVRLQQLLHVPSVAQDQ